MANVKLKSSPKRVSSTSRYAQRSAAQPETAPSSRSGTAAKAVAHPRTTKSAKVLSMLYSSPGTTIAAMMKETGWQQHSVRGFLAGVVRKRLGLNLVSQEAKGGRVYRVSGKRSKTRNVTKAKRNS